MESVSSEGEHVQRYKLSSASAEHPITAISCFRGICFAAVECTMYILTPPARKDCCALPFATSCMHSCAVHGHGRGPRLVVGGYRGDVAVLRVVCSADGSKQLQELSRLHRTNSLTSNAGVASLVSSAAAPLLPAVICADDVGRARLWLLQRSMRTFVCPTDGELLTETDKRTRVQIDLCGSLFCLCADRWAIVSDLSLRRVAARVPYPEACGVPQQAAAVCLVECGGSALLCVARRECVLVLCGGGGDDVRGEFSVLVLRHRILLDAQCSVPVSMVGDLCSGWIVILCHALHARPGIGVDGVSRISLQIRSVRDGALGAEFVDEAHSAFHHHQPMLASSVDVHGRFPCRVCDLVAAWPTGDIRTLRVLAPDH